VDLSFHCDRRDCCKNTAMQLRSNAYCTYAIFNRSRQEEEVYHFPQRQKRNLG
jgi:hypothetical protein